MDHPVAPIFKVLYWQEAMQESQDFLVKLCDPDISTELLTPTSPYILLPRITHIRLPPRLYDRLEAGWLPVLHRDIFQRLLNFVQNKEGLTYVFGPQGFGKSFALYHLFCTLSVNPQNRVLYIPSCRMLNLEPYNQIFRSIIAAFSFDVQFLHDMIPLTDKPCEQTWRELQAHIKAYCKANNLYFYAIFDQHNELDQASRAYSPTALLQWLDLLDGPQFKVVISASANNRDQELTKDAGSTFLFSEGLLPQELQSWRTKHSFFLNDSLDLLTELTANIPLELYEVLQAQAQLVSDTAPTLEAVLSLYYASRMTALQLGHDKYLQSNGATIPELRYSGVEHKCMLYMVTDIPLPIVTQRIYDRQLFILTPELLLKPAFPLARDMVRARLAPLDHEVLAKEVFSTAGLPNDAKGRMAEFYIIQRLIKRGRISMPLFKIGTYTKDTDLDHYFEIVQFHGLLPSTPPTQTTLFIPSSAQYNDVDFLLFVPTPTEMNPDSSYLYSFQVTVQAKPWDHDNRWVEGGVIYDLWKTFFPHSTTTKVWFVSTPMGPEIQPKNQETGKKKQVLSTGNLWVPFGDPTICTHFPALQYFCRQAPNRTINTKTAAATGGNPKNTVATGNPKNTAATGGNPKTAAATGNPKNTAATGGVQTKKVAKNVPKDK